MKAYGYNLSYFGWGDSSNCNIRRITGTNRDFTIKSDRLMRKRARRNAKDQIKEWIN